MVYGNFFQTIRKYFGFVYPTPALVKCFCEQYISAGVKRVISIGAGTGFFELVMQLYFLKVHYQSVQGGQNQNQSLLSRDQTQTTQATHVSHVQQELIELVCVDNGVDGLDVGKDLGLGLQDENAEDNHDDLNDEKPTGFRAKGTTLSHYFDKFQPNDGVFISWGRNTGSLHDNIWLQTERKVLRGHDVNIVGIIGSGAQNNTMGFFPCDTFGGFTVSEGSESSVSDEKYGGNSDINRDSSESKKKRKVNNNNLRFDRAKWKGIHIYTYIHTYVGLLGLTGFSFPI